MRLDELAQRGLLGFIQRAIPANVRGMRELTRAHRDEGWTLSQFLAESDIDVLDLCREGRT
jgi:hypothetical protein